MPIFQYRKQAKSINVEEYHVNAGRINHLSQKRSIVITKLVDTAKPKISDCSQKSQSH